MLQLLSHDLVGMTVMCVRLGGPIGVVTEVIIDPDQLQVAALRVSGREVRRGGPDLLLPMSIRECVPSYLVIDDVEDLVAADDVVRVKKILELNFSLIGLGVETKSGSKLGRVSDYTIDTSSFIILQLIVKRPLLKSLNDPELTVARREVMEVTDYKVIVKDEKKTAKKVESRQEFKPNYVNPFRNQEPGFAPIDTKNLVGKDS